MLQISELYPDSGYCRPITLGEGAQRQPLHKLVSVCETRYVIDIGDLIEWNPTLDADFSQCYLQEEFSYCVLKDKDSENCTCKSFDHYTEYFNMGRDSVLAVKVSFIG